MLDGKASGCSADSGAGYGLTAALWQRRSLGDQGIGGMGIPIGKLSLYTALGGIDPARTLPVLLDTGTDNAGLLDDPLYLGWRHRRIDGARYDDFLDRFVQAVHAELPGVLLQWEDFATPHALPVLARYRDQLLSFNDDIQGTAAVVLAALSAGAAATGSRLREQMVVMLGAGSAGIGVCEQVVRSMAADGLSERAARARICVVDVNGLLTTDRPDLDPAQRRLAQPPAAVPGTGPGRPAHPMHAFEIDACAMRAGCDGDPALGYELRQFSVSAGGAGTDPLALPG